MVHVASSSPPKMKGVAGLSPFFTCLVFAGLRQNGYSARNGLWRTVSSGRYMKQAGRFTLKTVADMAFWADFVGAETLFFLCKNCFYFLSLRVV